MGVVELCGRLLNTQEQSTHLDVLVQGAIEILRADSGYLVQQIDERLVFYRRWNNPVGKAEPVSRAIVADALSSPHAILVANASLDARYALRESVRSSSLRSVLAARIDTEEPVALYLESGSRQLNEEHRDLFQKIVDLSGSILRRSTERLQRMQSQELFERFDFHGIVARDPLMHQTLELVSKVAAADYPVLIQGPSGSGKELIANAIHRNSRRRDQPLITINCGAISANLLESELFGHTAGAFTGATASAPGLVRSAHGGTLLLDEVGDMPLELQVKLLRTLQSGEVQPVGAPRSERVDVRFLASTHRQLDEEIAKGTFREDLFQRLKTLIVDVPALSKRPADILPLFRHFLDRAARDLESGVPIIEPEAALLLQANAWTGNVRELENEAKRLVVLGGADPISKQRLSFGSTQQRADTDTPGRLVDEERALIRRHLEATQGNRSAAARALGISREGLRKKLIRLGIE